MVGIVHTWGFGDKVSQIGCDSEVKVQKVKKVKWTITSEMKVTMRSTVWNLQGKRKRQEGLRCKTMHKLSGPGGRAAV